MIVFALDPGTTETGAVLYDAEEERVVEAIVASNEALLDRLRQPADLVAIDATLVIELIDRGGMADRALFRTCIWSGRFAEAWEHSTGQIARWVPRSDVKNHLTRKPTAGDKHVRAALIARFGPQGNAKSPGPLYGVTSHKLAALAVAVTYADEQDLRARIRRPA